MRRNITRACGPLERLDALLAADKLTREEYEELTGKQAE